MKGDTTIKDLIKNKKLFYSVILSLIVSIRGDNNNKNINIILV